MNEIARRIQFHIAPEDEGKTVEQFLRWKMGISRKVVVSLKHRPGGLLKNGVHVRTIDPLQAGDLLELNLPQIPAVKGRRKSDIEVDILYEDDDVIVYNKPANMPCHTSGSHWNHTLANVWAAHCEKLGLLSPFRPINRLDKDTTGAVVAAKNQLAGGKLWKAVAKVYIGIVEGVLLDKAGTVNLPIDRMAPLEQRRVVCAQGQPAVTHYEVLAIAPDESCSLVAFRLETGRTHQIRVHMSHMGHPLAGDSLYGKSGTLMTRQALHCRQVAFPHPVTGKQVRVTAPYPADFAEAMQIHQLNKNSL